MPIFFHWHVDENVNSADEGSIDSNCLVLVGLNLAFPEASWDDTQCAMSDLYDPLTSVCFSCSTGLECCLTRCICKLSIMKFLF